MAYKVLKLHISGTAYADIFWGCFENVSTRSPTFILRKNQVLYKKLVFLKFLENDDIYHMTHVGFISPFKPYNFCLKHLFLSSKIRKLLG